MIANDYNKRIALSLQDINYKFSKDDVLTNTRTPLVGGSKYRSQDINPAYVQTQEQMGRKFIKAGRNVDYPQLNSMELERFNKTGINPYKVGGRQMRGGDFWGDVGNFFKPIGSAILDVAAPAVGAFVGGPVGATMAKGAREGIRAVTGVGIRRTKKAGAMTAGKCKAGAKTAGVGTYSAGCNGDMSCGPCNAKKGKKCSAGAKSGNRMDIVKKIMKEKGLPLGAASKWVKDNGLYLKK